MSTIIRPSSAPFPGRGFKSRNVEASAEMRETTSIEALSKQNQICEEARVGSQKRDLELDENESGAGGSKRTRLENTDDGIPGASLRTRFDRCATMCPGHYGSVGDVRSAYERESHPLQADDTVSSSSSSTPSSTSTHDGLNDSQDTIITEPDDVVISRIMSRVEIQQRARALLLRLRLATYKIRTDQIDLPMSELQIKSTAAKSPELPALPSANTSRRRTPLPSSATLSKVPNIQVHSIYSSNRRPAILSSPEPYLELAPPYEKVRNRNQESLATPLLPRNRRGLLDPLVLESPASEECLTSSVVKGRAADGLLSLMWQ